MAPTPPPVGVVLRPRLLQGGGQVAAGVEGDGRGGHARSEGQGRVRTHLGQALILANQLIAVELGWLVLVAVLQLMQLMTHGLEHGMVVVHRA